MFEAALGWIVGTAFFALVGFFCFAGLESLLSSWPALGMMLEDNRRARTGLTSFWTGVLYGAIFNVAFGEVERMLWHEASQAPSLTVSIIGLVAWTGLGFVIQKLRS